MSTGAVLSGPERRATGEALRDGQGQSGLITWYRGGHGDPWNHVEAAMALDVAGQHDCAATAYQWLERTQREDGSWFASYHDDASVRERHVDTNAVAYVATGAYHHLLATGDEAFFARVFPVVERAVGFVLGLQRDDGAIPWELDADGRPGAFALVAGCSSIFASLRAALALAARRGERRQTWRDAARRLRSTLLRDPAAFSAKDEFAMDWYYPVLTGVTSRPAATERLLGGLDRFVTPWGVRCRADGPWVTTAETAEASLAFTRAGLRTTARALLATVADKRAADGAYRTGLVYPGRQEFPRGEVTTYSAAAVLLADDALRPSSATARLLGVAGTSQRCSTRRLAQESRSTSTTYPEPSAAR